MKYYIDTEFIEDFTRPFMGKPLHYIDLISIGIVAEDGREYYAISNDFDIDYAWHKYQIETDFGKPQGLGDRKVYWLRDNVLWPLVHDAVTRYSHGDQRNEVIDGIEGKGKLSALKWIVKKYGKPNKQIAFEINQFVNDPHSEAWKKWIGSTDEYFRIIGHGQSHDFYGYYADYDHVLLCSLYGRMLDLPKGFPMYCRDLKQTMDEKATSLSPPLWGEPSPRLNLDGRLHLIKQHPLFPLQPNSHHALDDARWNKKLHEFLRSI